MRKTTLTILLLLLALTACRKDAPAPGGGLPVSFSTDSQGQSADASRPAYAAQPDGIARTKAGLSTFFESFKVWGTVTDGEGTSSIMEGYRVNYDPVLLWTYTDVEGTEGQELQFWSQSDASYTFHAAAPLERINELTANSVNLSLSTTKIVTETALLSEPYRVSRSDPEYGNTVNLKFRYANARVNIAVKYLTDTPLEITGLTLTPPAPYAIAATLGFDYDWSRTEVVPGTLNITAQSSDGLTFPGLSIPADSEEFYETSEPWYVIPDPASKGQWTVTLNIGGSTRTVQFTMSKAWESGKSYLYRFEYTDKANLVFVGTEELFIGKTLENGGEHTFE
ncbi:MAG: fimbrillin family protein [Candidatus Cryptobacteroides sp.]